MGGESNPTHGNIFKKRVILVVRFMSFLKKNLFKWNLIMWHAPTKYWKINI